MNTKIMNASMIYLDCTLRDGGYVNNWEFDQATATDIRDSLYRAGIRYIELGLVGRGGVPGKCTKFSDFLQIEPLLANRKEDCTYVVMVTQAEYAKMGLEIPDRNEKTPDMIRLAYFKPEAEEAMETARLMLEKGYIVFLQAMATFMYSEMELEQHIQKVNQVHPQAFYIVDSFSTMYPADVIKMQAFVMKRLDKNIAFGFHAHNNIQMAYANVLTFLEHGDGRTLVADGSIFGMGRGAGNVPIELLLEYANKQKGEKYDIQQVLDVFSRRIEPIFKELPWGYSIPYLLTASKNMNSVYGWYFMTHGISNLKEYTRALDMIPEDVRYTLSRKDADDAILYCRGDKE